MYNLYRLLKINKEIVHSDFKTAQICCLLLQYHQIIYIFELNPTLVQIQVK